MTADNDKFKANTDADYAELMRRGMDSLRKWLKKHCTEPKNGA